MSESLRDLVVSLSLNTNNFTRNINSVNKQIREAESYFKLASSGVKGFEGSTAGLSAKLEMLNTRLSLQKSVVDQYGKALEAAKNKLQECYTRQETYQQRLKTAKETQESLRKVVQQETIAYEDLKQRLGETDARTVAARATLDAAVASYDSATEEVRKLSGQCDALQRSTQNAADAVSTTQTQLNKARAAVRETQEAIEDTNEELRKAQSRWTAAGNSLTEFSEKAKALAESMNKMGRTLTTHLTAPITALATASVKASIEFESSFAMVQKTVNGTEEEMNRLAAASKRMSTEVAASTTTINEVMATAGQLGIATDKIEQFSRVMLDIGNSSVDLSANEAATSIAKFVNIMGTGQDAFGNIGSTIVELGNNFATTEAPIMLMAQRLAAAGKQVGMSEADILAFSAALSSVGIEAQMGGSAFSKALVKMEVAAKQGGSDLEDFAKVAGVSASEFKAMWERDASQAFMSFIVGLSKLDDEGESAIAVLNDIGISEIRLRDTLLRATNATDLFQSALDRANSAWDKNNALSSMANIKYGTTQSKITNLKNKATLLAQTIGDDLNPTIQEILEWANGLIDRFSALDASERQQIIKIAAITAAIGPALVLMSKVTKGISTITGSLGQFATAVSGAGGGFGGFLKTLAGSPAVWMAVGVAAAVAAKELLMYLTYADEVEESLNGLKETARSWKETAADSFYTASRGLSFFGMDTSDFQREKGNAQAWKDGIIAIWTDGKKETDEVITQWIDSFKGITESTRTELKELQSTANSGGYSDIASEIQKDIDQLDAMDAEIEKLLKKKKNKKLTEKEKVRLQELIDTREAIEVKYHLSAADEDGFDTLRTKLDAQIARAQARGQEVTAEVYENTLVAGAQGMDAVNRKLDEQYDKEHAVIMLIEDEAERQGKLDELNARYRENRLSAAREYAELMKSAVMPVWEKTNIQNAKAQVADLASALNEYSTACTDAEKADALKKLDQITAGMSEKDLVEYVGLLTQIQSLLDSGMTLDEIEGMFPDIDITSTLDQLAAIQTYLNRNAWDSNLTSLREMFGESLGEEILVIATDLNMTGAKARWNEWAQDPGSITTEATVYAYKQAQDAVIQQPAVEAMINAYTEIPEGASKSRLKPEGICAYVAVYAENTTGVDVSALNPTNITAMVAAYDELASGTDISLLKPDEITAYVMKYLEEHDADTSGLTPGAVTAFVMAYEELNGHASTDALKPGDIVGLVAKYCEDENVDISQLSPDQIMAIVDRFAEATGCDRSALLKDFVAYVTEYKEANDVKRPALNMSIGLTGYDLLAYRQLLAKEKVEVEGIVRLTDVYDETGALLKDEHVKFWKNGVSLPVTAVTPEMLSPDDVCVLDKDGTMHVLIKTEITGSKEVVEEMAELVAQVDQIGVTTLGYAVGIKPITFMSYVEDALKQFAKQADPGFLDFVWLENIFSDSEERLDTYVRNNFSAKTIAALSTYVAETVKAIMNGTEIPDENMEPLKKILKLVQELDSIGIGKNVTTGIAEGMTAAGWEATADTVADELEKAVKQALEIHSPSQLMNPIGENVSAGIAEGVTAYDFGAAGTSVAQRLKSAMETVLNKAPLRGIGMNAMRGLAEGIDLGREAVIQAMRNAARAAVNAAKEELKIASPSRVFRDEVGVMTMRGMTEGILGESKETEKTIRNASRYFTDSAMEEVSGAFASQRNVYNNTNTISFDGSSFYIRDEQDVHSLAIEIASLTRRQMRGKGMKMA